MAQVRIRWSADWLLIGRQIEREAQALKRREMQKFLRGRESVGMAGFVRSGPLRGLNEPTDASNMIAQ